MKSFSSLLAKSYRNKLYIQINITFFCEERKAGKATETIMLKGIKLRIRHDILSHFFDGLNCG